MKVASTEKFDELVSFGESTMDKEMQTLAENILIRCICKDKNVNTFNQLRHKVNYKKSKELGLKKLPATSSSVLLHIKRAYLQTYIWLLSAFVESIVINPLEYGYELEDDDEEMMTPKIIEKILPDELPRPYKCVKCAKSNVCTCRVNKIRCCQYYNCKTEICQNQLNYVSDIALCWLHSMPLDMYLCVIYEV